MVVSLFHGVDNILEYILRQPTRNYYIYLLLQIWGLASNVLLIKLTWGSNIKGRANPPSEKHLKTSPYEEGSKPENPSFSTVSEVFTADNNLQQWQQLLKPSPIN